MKIPKIEKLPSGNYFCRLRLNGVSVPITAETEAECKRIAELKKAEYNAGKTYIQRTPKETTLQQAMDKYLNANKATLSPSTYRAYTIYARNRFPDYRNKKLKEIKWQEMIDDELDLASPKTVKNAWALIVPSLKHIGYPVPSVKLAQVAVPDLNFLQPEEIKKFCATIKGKPFEIAALLELHGLRVSEARALSWKNIDLVNGTITIAGAKVHSLDGDVLKKTTKNVTSARTVPIMIPRLLTILKAVDPKTDPVVKQSAGVLLEDIQRACQTAGVTVCGNHDLRRSFASLCYFLGIPTRQIQKWGGWANDTTLQRVYIKLSASMQTESQKKFSSFFDS